VIVIVFVVVVLLFIVMKVALFRLRAKIKIFHSVDSEGLEYHNNERSSRSSVRF
jgi:hypothetical protein